MTERPRGAIFDPNFAQTVKGAIAKNGSITVYSSGPDWGTIETWVVDDTWIIFHTNIKGNRNHVHSNMSFEWRNILGGDPVSNVYVFYNYWDAWAYMVRGAKR